MILEDFGVVLDIPSYSRLNAAHGSRADGSPVELMTSQPGRLGIKNIIFN